MKAKPNARAALRERAIAVAWGLATLVGVLVVGVVLSQNHTGAVLAQVVVAEFGTGRVGVAWSDPLAAMPTAKDIARRAGRGFSLGAAAGVMLIGATVAARAATLEIGDFGLAALVSGFVSCACVAARDELLLRGLVLRVLGPNAAYEAKLAVCAVAGVAFRFGTQPAATWAALVVTTFLSIASACLWLRDRGAWLAVAAQTAFLFVSGPVSQGAILDVRGSAPIDTTIPAVVVAVVAAISAIAWTRKKVASPS